MENMPQDSLKSGVYRSFVTCDDPRGILKCKTIRKSKTETSKMGDHLVKQRTHNNFDMSSSKKEGRKVMSCQRPSEELNSASSVQLAEVSRGAQNLIDSLSRGIIAKDLLRGALDLQESLVMLGRLQEASKLKKKPREKAVGKGDFNGLGIVRTKSERIGEYNKYPMEFEKPRFSVDGASRDCYDELREVIRESFSRQNLLPPNCVEKMVSFESREVELSTSSSQSSFEKGCFDRRKMGFSSTSSSQSSMFQSQEFPSSLPEVKKPKGPNLIAKLMGLEEISSKPIQTTLQKQFEKERIFNPKRPIFEIDLPKAKKPPPYKVDPKHKTLDEIIETMQLKGLLKSKFIDESKHETRHHIVSDLERRSFDGSQPIVIMKPQYDHDLPEERLYTSAFPSFKSASDNKEKVRKSRREEFLPDWKKGAENDQQMMKSTHQKGDKERRETKLSSIKTKAFTDPGKPRQQKKEVVENKLDKIQKVAPNLRKTEGMKNARVKDAAKLRKADTVPHVSEKQVTQIKKSTSDIASKRATAAPSHNSRKRKNMKTDKPLVSKQVENKGDKDVQIDLIIKKATCKTENKVEESERLCFQEASDVHENQITDDHISDESLPCDSTMCDANIESREHKNSCTIPVLNDNTNSELTSATRNLLLSSESFLNQAEELFHIDVCQSAESLKPDCSQDEMAETKLLLDCACELLNNKKLQCTLSFDLLSKKPIRPKLGVSLEKLVAEICEGIESLRSYKDLAGKLTADTIFSLTEKDLWCNGVVNGVWDLGWSKGFTSDEVEKIVADIEKHMLCGVIEDTIADFTL